MANDLQLEPESLLKLRRAARDSTPVAGFTHAFYRYPARFSPAFARAAIELFTKPGDLVLDPFSGGGTTVVEAYALGRSAVGSDISHLAAFIGQVKVTPLSANDVFKLRTWF